MFRLLNRQKILNRLAISSQTTGLEGSTLSLSVSSAGYKMIKETAKFVDPNGNPIVGRSISFMHGSLSSLGVQDGSDTTDASGSASVTGMIYYGGGSHAAQAVFDGDSTFLPNSVTSDFQESGGLVSSNTPGTHTVQTKTPKLFGAKCHQFDPPFLSVWQPHSIPYNIRYVTADLSFQPWYMNAYNAAVADGFDLLGNIQTNTMKQTYGSGWTLANWQDAWTRAMSTFPAMQIWEVWNEPTVPSYYSGYYTGGQSLYLNLLKAAYSIAKAHGKTVVGIGGAFCDYNKTLNNYNWVKTLWSLGAGQFCDAISVHIYNHTYGSDFILPDGLTVAQSISDSLDRYHQLTGKPIYITETGKPVNQYGTDFQCGTSLGNTEATQNAWAETIYNICVSKPYVSLVQWFEAVKGINENVPCDYGLVSPDPNYSPRPALATIQAIASAL